MDASGFSRTDPALPAKSDPSEQEGPDSLIQLELGLKGLQCQSECGVSFYRHDLERSEELPALAVKEAVCGEARDCGHCAGKLIGQRTNDRYVGEVGVDEFARDWEDQAGLNEGGGLQRWVVEEIRK